MSLEEFKRILLYVRDITFEDFEDKKLINKGHCADFATIVWEKCGCNENVIITNNEELSGDLYRHTFIQFESRYYDSECEDGVEEWSDLPIFTR